MEVELIAICRKHLGRALKWPELVILLDTVCIEKPQLDESRPCLISSATDILVQFHT